MRTKITIMMIVVSGFCLALSQEAQAWRGGGGFRAGGFRGGGFGGFRDGGFGGASSFHAGGFGGGYGSVHYAGASHYGPATGFSHVGGATYSGAGGTAHYGSATHAGYGGTQHYSSAGYAGYGGAAHYSSTGYASRSVNYGSIQHYGASSNLNVYHGPAGGTAARYQGAYVSGAAVKGPAGYGAAAVKGPAGGTAAAYRGPYSSGAVAHLPSGYTAATWHGTTYYHSGYSFYHPTWYAGTVYYAPIYPPVGFFFASLPTGATETVVNNNTYYVSDDVYYQPTTQNGQQGYAVAAAPEQSEASPQGAPAAESSPDPFKLLKKMSDYMGGEQHIRMTVSETYDEVAAGQKVQLFSERTIQLKRPDRISVEVSGAGIQRRITCDGETFTAVDLLKNVYATMPMQGSLDMVMDKLAQQYGMAQPMEDLLYSDINERLTPKLQSGQFLGQENIAGHTCNHLAFKQAGLSWQVWIDDGLKPVPWKLVISYDSAPGRPQYTLLITKFETPVVMSDLDFKARLPDGAMSASLLSLTGQAAGSQ